MMLVLLILPFSGFAEGVDESAQGRWVEEIELRGGVSFGREKLDLLLTEYEGGILFEEDLVTIRNLVTNFYIDAGYLSTGAVVPRDQNEAGILYVDVIEGSLPELHIVTTGRLSPSYITELILNRLDLPLNINQLQSAIKKVEQDAHVEYLQAQLQPGEERGSSRLLLSVVEKNPFYMEMGVNNYRSPSVGEEQIQLALGHNNLTGRGDEISAFYDFTEGTDGGGVNYKYPFLRFDSTLELYYLSASSLITERPFDEIDIKSETKTLGLSLMKSRGDLLSHVNYGLGFERKSSHTSLLGQPYDFSIGSVNGESKSSLLIVMGEYVRRRVNSAMTFRMNYRRDVKPFGLEPLAEPADDFQVLITQFRFIRKVSLFNRDDLIWKLHANLQLTPDSLPSFERISLGGYHSVRGYRENSLLTDNGLEVLGEVEIPFYSGFGGAGKLKVAFVPFIGYAKGWNTVDPSNARDIDELFSIGLGVKLSHQAGIIAQLFWGKQINQSESAGNSLQDDGVHAEVKYVF